MNKKYLLISECARLRKVTNKTVWNWIRKHGLPHQIEYGRTLVHEKDLIKFKTPKCGAPFGNKNQRRKSI